MNMTASTVRTHALILQRQIDSDSLSQINLLLWDMYLFPIFCFKRARQASGLSRFYQEVRSVSYQNPYKGGEFLKHWKRIQVPEKHKINKNKVTKIVSM
jgi:hypothetical protein